MSQIVVEGAELRCLFGQNPASLKVVNAGKIKIKGKKAATILDFAPGACIGGFGQCQSPLNPAVLAAFGAPQPCTPLIVAPWTPGSTKTRLLGIPVLVQPARTSCAYAPMGISITDPKQDLAETA